MAVRFIKISALYYEMICDYDQNTYKTISTGPPDMSMYRSSEEIAFDLEVLIYANWC